MQRHQQAERIGAALLNIPAEYREIVVMRFQEELALMMSIVRTEELRWAAQTDQLPSPRRGLLGEGSHCHQSLSKEVVQGRRGVAGWQSW